MRSLMADSLDDGEFWLPPQFLVDDEEDGDILRRDRRVCEADAVVDREEFASCPFVNPSVYGASRGASGLCSPVESVVGSSETESDEEEYMAHLTWQMAQSTLEYGVDSKKLNGGALSGSPKSTLCASSACGCRQGLGNCRPDSRFSVSSPATSWDLVGGEVMGMKEEGRGFYHSRGPSCHSNGLSLKSVPVKNSDPDVGYYQQLQFTQFQRLREEQMMRQQNMAAWGGQRRAGGRFQQQKTQKMVPNGGRNCDLIGIKNCRPEVLSTSLWNTQLQAQNLQQGSGMMAMFLGTPSGKKECSGTGVFLPRHVGTQSETRKKPACSTVLVPARVMQALNLNLEARGMKPQVQPSFSGRHTSDGDGLSSIRSTAMGSNGKRNLRPHPATNPEIRLPQEWTY